MPTPGQISKENLKQILVFFPAVVYNICVVLFSFQLNYTTQKRICPACGLQILFCLLGAFFHSPGSTPAENQAASTAATVAALKDDFNALLAKLKEAGLMAADTTADEDADGE